MHTPKASAMQKSMDTSQIPVAWMPPKSQLPDKLEEHADDVSGTFAVAGCRGPSGSRTGGMQTNQSKAAVIEEAQTGVMLVPRAPAVTGAQAARYAAKGEAWDRMLNEYWAARKKDAEEKKVQTLGQSERLRNPRYVAMCRRPEVRKTKESAIYASWKCGKSTGTTSKKVATTRCQKLCMPAEATISGSPYATSHQSSFWRNSPAY